MLETVDIQNADKHLRPVCRFAVFAGQTLVDNGHKPFEKASVDELSHGIPDTSCLCNIQRGDDLLVPSDELFLDRPLFEVGQGNPKEASSHLEGRVNVIDSSFVAHCGDLDVPKVQESRKELENGPLLLHADPDGRKGVLGLPELFGIVNAINRSRRRTALLEVVEFSNVGIEAQVLSFF